MPFLTASGFPHFNRKMCSQPHHYFPNNKYTHKHQNHICCSFEPVKPPHTHTTPNHFCHKGRDDWKYKFHQRANKALHEHTQHTARALPAAAAAVYSVSYNHSTKGMGGKYSDMSVTQSDCVPQLLSQVLFMEQLQKESLPCFARNKFNILQSCQMSN